MIFKNETKDGTYWGLKLWPTVYIAICKVKP